MPKNTSFSKMGWPENLDSHPPRLEMDIKKSWEKVMARYWLGRVPKKTPYLLRTLQRQGYCSPLPDPCGGGNSTEWWVRNGGRHGDRKPNTNCVVWCFKRKVKGSPLDQRQVLLTTSVCPSDSNIAPIKSYSVGSLYRPVQQHARTQRRHLPDRQLDQFETRVAWYPQRVCQIGYSYRSSRSASMASRQVLVQ